MKRMKTIEKQRLQLLNFMHHFVAEKNGKKKKNKEEKTFSNFP